MTVSQSPDRPASTMVLVICAPIAAALGGVWSPLTIRINASHLPWSSGPGRPRFPLELAHIKAVEGARTTGRR